MNYRPAQAAAFLGVAEQTLAKWRVNGGGPPFRKLGHVVVYPEKELLAWLEAQPLVHSTSDDGRTYRGKPRGRPRRSDAPELASVGKEN